MEEAPCDWCGAPCKVIAPSTPLEDLIDHIMGVGMDEKDREIAHWKKIALYLADCHAATAADDANVKSLGKFRRKRFLDIASKAAKLLDGTDIPYSFYGHADLEVYRKSVVDRCYKALDNAKEL